MRRYFNRFTWVALQAIMARVQCRPPGKFLVFHINLAVAFLEMLRCAATL